ncbi:MAG TPA: nitrilase-related carbon-nitrogen hydrolase [Ignavibacteria bacterium]|nr:nitrilase-related carbon-nitrogen hydrolase [Ignavibacteria bacterium]HMR39586.1 nitrilase-related carbon-nitrogen hydrolase [Ignavibacteria bacterium]
MKIGYLQFKPEFGNPDKNISRITDMISDKEFDLLVIPELANSGYLFIDKSELTELAEDTENCKFCMALKEICIEKKTHIVSGLCERSGNNIYNSSVLVYPDGNISVYRKIHLFDEEKLWFVPGDSSPEVYEIKGDNFGKVKIGMMICFDWFFPETARTLALKGAQIICHPSNLVMAYCQSAMFTRALENRVFTVTANRIGYDVRENKKLFFTGESVIVSPKGEYLCRGSKDKEEICIKDIDPDLALNKYLNDRNNIFTDRKKEFYNL